MNKNQRVVILSAPSGAGKSTLAAHLYECFPQLTLSVSATTRPLRGEEIEGREYYFLSNTEFDEKIRQDAFVEWEEVYQGVRYGTLRTELERIWERGGTILFDVDVQGGLRLKRIFEEQALSIFIQPPSLEALRERLEKRGTDSKESIQKRVDKAEKEMGFAPSFDAIVVNNVLEDAKTNIEKVAGRFLDDVGKC